MSAINNSPEILIIVLQLADITDKPDKGKVALVLHSHLLLEGKGLNLQLANMHVRMLFLLPKGPPSTMSLGGLAV